MRWTLLLLLLACDDADLGTEAQSGDAAHDARTRADSSPRDAEAPDLSPPDAARLDLAIDASPLDATPDAAPPPDATRDAAADAAEPDAKPPIPDAEVECPEREPYDYTCDAEDEATCPGGICLFGGCIGPVVDQARWEDCGDGQCAPCEECPADCEAPPAFMGEKVYDNDTTISVELHGFNVVNAEDFDETVYGEARGGGDALLRRFHPELLQGREHPEAPNQVVGVEYYGGTPAEWLSPEQIELIESFDVRTNEALARYAHVAAFFIRHRMALSGATHVNLFCHSMGCHVSRYLIEHDLEGLASGNHIVRWVTQAGVVAGARLARLFDNPVVRDIAEGLQLNTSDFIHMHPDYVREHTAIWDHQLHRAGNPLLGGVLMHHLVATNPAVSATADLVRLLDLNNPEDEPNDGIQYSLDEYFHEQPEALRFRTLAGEALMPTRSYLFIDHLEIGDTEGANALIAAGLFARRKVYLTVRDIELRSDREGDDVLDFEEQGRAPAEIAVQSVIRYPRPDGNVVVGEQRVEHRSPEIFHLREGRPIDADYRIFEAPVFDDMQTLGVQLDLLEVDFYPRFGVREWALDIHESLGGLHADLPLEDGRHVIDTEYVRAEIELRVVELY